jgi:hypothetical protein
LPDSSPATWVRWASGSPASPATTS